MNIINITNYIYVIYVKLYIIIKTENPYDIYFRFEDRANNNNKLLDYIFYIFIVTCSFMFKYKENKYLMLNNDL